MTMKKNVLILITAYLLGATPGLMQGQSAQPARIPAQTGILSAGFRGPQLAPVGTLRKQFALPASPFSSMAARQGPLKSQAPASQAQTAMEGLSREMPDFGKMGSGESRTEAETDFMARVGPYSANENVLTSAAPDLSEESVVSRPDVESRVERSFTEHGAIKTTWVQRFPPGPVSRAFAPDGNSIVMVENANTLRVLDLVTGRARILQKVGRLPNNTELVPTIHMGRYVVTLFEDKKDGDDVNTIRIWDLDREVIRDVAIPNRLGRHGWFEKLPEGRVMVAGFLDFYAGHKLLRLDPSSGKLETMLAKGFYTGDTKLSSDGRNLIFFESILARKNGRFISSIEIESGKKTDRAIIGLVRGESYPPRLSAISPDGKTALLYQVKIGLSVVQLRTGKVLRRIKPDGYVSWAKFSPDGARVRYSQEDEGVLTDWNWRSGGAARFRIPKIPYSPETLYSEDGRKVFSREQVIDFEPIVERRRPLRP